MEVFCFVLNNNQMNARTQGSPVESVTVDQRCSLGGNVVVVVWKTIKVLKEEQIMSIFL